MNITKPDARQLGRQFERKMSSLVRVVCSHKLKGFSVRDFGGGTQVFDRGKRTVYVYYVERSRLDEAIKKGAVPTPLKGES